MVGMQHLLSFIHTPSFTEYLEQFSYAGVFIWFTVFDFVAPFPDEVSLLTVGYLASLGYFNPFLVAIIPFVSFLLTDSISFYLARGGRTIFGKHSKKRRAPRRGSFRAFVTRSIEKNFPLTIIAVSFIPKMRVWGPIVSGTLRVPYRKFILNDAVGVALFVILYTNLGYFFGVSLSSIFKELKTAQSTIFVIILLLLGIALFFVEAKTGGLREHETNE